MRSDSNLNEFIQNLKQTTSGDLRTDSYSKILYSTDASIYQVMPLAVFIPRTMEDVHAAVELAAQHKIPILPRTSGSSLAGQAVNEAVIIDFSRHLDSVLEVNADEQWVRIRPGIVLDELNLHLKPYGLQFGPDPASSNRAAMGGIVANNSTGSHSIVYGMTADHVLETKVFLSNGDHAHFKSIDPELLKQSKKAGGLEGQIYRRIHEIARQNSNVIRRGTPRHWRRCGGYNLDRFIDNGVSFKWPQQTGFNLAKLICGSEGTLAVIEEIKLALVPRPKMTALAIVQFQSLYDALSAAPVILQVEPSAVELLDNLGLTLCKQVPAYARLLKTFLSGEPNCVLITEFYGDSESELKAKIDSLTAHLKKQMVNAEVAPVLDPLLQQNVWTVRKVGLGLMMSIKGDHKPVPFIEDAAVPVEHLADYVTQIEKFCGELGTKVAYYAHASAGCVHIRPLINAKVASEIEKLPKISQFSVELLGQYGGVLSSEHGDGRSRSWLNEHFYGKELYGLFKEVKRAFDPHNIFNPGIIVDPQYVTDNLRYGEKYSAIEIEAQYNFSAEQGFDRAIEMCNGAGVCRKTATGTMCPSFMATREEEHSTRGRANALRAALSGKLDPKELTSKRMFEVMDLCIECKACKAECPSSVDMAKIKFEFLAQYYRKNKIPLRSRLFADVAKLNRFSRGALASLSNWIYDLKPARVVMDSLLGISSRRQLPKLAKEPFTDWLQQRRDKSTNQESKKQVVLFCDTFNTYNEPQVLIAATEVLEALGFEVLLSNHGCCGRPMISKGLAEKARQAARTTVDALYPKTQKDIPIIGLEPSCLLTLRDENLYLLPDDPAAKNVAANCFLFEEFIANLADDNKLSLDFSGTAQKILLHGHCHQKSLVGTGPVTRMLKLPENYRVEEVDSGCCGMAGSFGYESEHYEISMQMAERRLLPAIRKEPHDTLIAASGFSCRHQIRHGAGRTALHPVEILRKAMVQ